MGIESPVHLLFIAIIALIVLGPKRLPELARAVGKGVREFRGAIEEGQNQDDPPEPGGDGLEHDEQGASATGNGTPAHLAPGDAAPVRDEPLGR